MLRAVLLSVLLALTGLAAMAEPSDAMFEKLKNAPSEAEANDIAQDIWASWLESGSPTVDMIMQRGVDAQKVGMLDVARTFYDRAILIKPDYAEAWNRRATIFMQQENFTEALRDLNEALKLEPRHFGAWSQLAMLFEAMDAPDQALDAWREALAVYPTMREARSAEKRLVKQAEGRGL
ncbi:MAG TPA: tetratricopeptide repeat protein [Hyphomonas sp.]|nr:tetratricopeptide repeat protein [Hyphomonas sp.]HPE47299.1 tetratricopeptide repeat protein [Hyphomonas sp.]